jgi:hypothetical protein
MDQKLIDVLHQALLKAGYKVERDGWEDSIMMEKDGKKELLKDDAGNLIKDHCEWLDIIGPVEEDGQQTSLHFYFEEDATVLTNVHIFRDDWRLTDREKKTAGMFKLKRKE